MGDKKLVAIGGISFVIWVFAVASTASHWNFQASKNGGAVTSYYGGLWKIHKHNDGNDDTDDMPILFDSKGKAYQDKEKEANRMKGWSGALLYFMPEPN